MLTYLKVTKQTQYMQFVTTKMYQLTACMHKNHRLAIALLKWCVGEELIRT